MTAKAETLIPYEEDTGRGPHSDGGALSREHCHDCYAVEGEIHEWGCDMEWCPFCGGQILSCSCNPILDPDQIHVWTGEKIAARVPRIVFPLFCARCGEQWPEFFSVPTDEWRRNVPRDHWGDILCRKCYDEVAQMMQQPNKKVRHNHRPARTDSVPGGFRETCQCGKTRTVPEGHVEPESVEEYDAMWREP